MDLLAPCRRSAAAPICAQVPEPAGAACAAPWRRTSATTSTSLTSPDMRTRQRAASWPACRSHWRACWLSISCAVRLWFLLPQPHRAAIAPLLESTVACEIVLAHRRRLPRSSWTAILGMIAHVRAAWMVLRIRCCRSRLSVWGRWHACKPCAPVVPSSLVAAGHLALAYGSWLRQQPRSQPEAGSDGDFFRYFAVIAAAAVSVAVAFPLALKKAACLGRMSRTKLVVQLAIRTGTVLGAILLLHCCLRRRSRSVVARPLRPRVGGFRVAGSLQNSAAPAGPSWHDKLRSRTALAGPADE